MAVCDFHGEVKEVINNHEVRIRDLEIDGATRDEKDASLVVKIEDLIIAIKWLIAGGASALGSLYWYVLTIPR